MPPQWAGERRKIKGRRGRRRRRGRRSGRRRRGRRGRRGPRRRRGIGRTSASFASSASSASFLRPLKSSSPPACSAVSTGPNRPGAPAPAANLPVSALAPHGCLSLHPFTHSRAPASRGARADLAREPTASSGGIRIAPLAWRSSSRQLRSVRTSPRTSGAPDAMSAADLVDRDLLGESGYRLSAIGYRLLWRGLRRRGTFRPLRLCVLR